MWHDSWKLEYWNKKRWALLVNWTVNTFMQQWIDTEQQTNYWKRCFLCDPCQGYIVRASSSSHQSSQSHGTVKYGYESLGTQPRMTVLARTSNTLPDPTQSQTVSCKRAVAVHVWLQVVLIFVSCYLVTTSDDRITNRRIGMCCVSKVCNLVRLFLSFVVTNYVSNLIINPKPLSSHYHMQLVSEVGLVWLDLNYLIDCIVGLWMIDSM
jgi:hypothetical protein